VVTDQWSNSQCERAEGSRAEAEAEAEVANEEASAFDSSGVCLVSC